MILCCQPRDKNRIYFIINKAAIAYQGKIPADLYREPIMPMYELEREMKRITFYGFNTGRELVAIMGIEKVSDATLIRHTYVLPQWQRQGIASRLFIYVKNTVSTPILLVGTWTAADWAISFYKKHGFKMMPNGSELLSTYWDIPQRQMDTSVVLGMKVD